MAMMGAIGGIIGGVASMAGSMMSAKAQQEGADREREISKWNAARQREEAAWAQSKGATEARQKEREVTLIAGKAAATMAQSGISTTSGTPLLLQQQFEADKVYNSRVEMANASKTQNDMMNRAAITEYEGETQARAMEAQAKATLLSGFAGAVKGIGGAFG